MTSMLVKKPSHSPAEFLHLYYMPNEGNNQSLIGNRLMFPFAVKHVTQADAASCEKLCLERMGDDVVIRVKD